jgi:8-hydroxy-5-deazaflavin:NADPH oxidoreductase
MTWKREFSSSTSYNMNTAIIGLGNIGAQLARNLTAGGENVIVADRTLAKAEKLAAELCGKAESMAIADAINKADVVILAVYFDVMRDLIATHRSSLAGKIVVDPSNPIAPDGKGGFRKTIAPDESSGQLIAALLPEGAEFVKAFGTLSAQSLGDAVNRNPEHAVLFYATDYPEAGRVVGKLIRASGFSPVSVGGVDQSIRIEVGGDLHEFGKLGKLVSVKEAEELL